MNEKEPYENDEEGSFDDVGTVRNDEGVSFSSEEAGGGDGETGSAHAAVGRPPF